MHNPLLPAFPANSEKASRLLPPNVRWAPAARPMRQAPSIIRWLQDVPVALDAGWGRAFALLGGFMQSGIAESALSYPSKDGSTTIRARLWAPVGQGGAPVAPRAIVQIVHGMCEHMGRYDEFARFLARNGFAVCGEDHIGHGESASDPAEFGHMPPREGKDVLIADVCALRRLMRERFGEGVPYFLFGHSMGSFIVRAYLARPCARNLSGAVICGTGEQPRALSAAGNLLARIIGRACSRSAGPTSTSSWGCASATTRCSSSIPKPR